MAASIVEDRPVQQVDRHAYGALVGWKRSAAGTNLQIELQSVVSQEAYRHGEIDTTHLVMSRQQALQLANYLFTMAGAEPPRQRRGLAKLLG